MSYRVSECRAYFHRIGLPLPATVTAPSVAVLHQIHRRHALTIPFANVDVLNGTEISLDPQDILRKMLRRGQGGYCFEHNVLLGEILESLGFGVTKLAARVLWTTSAPATRPQTHLLLRVDTMDEGPWLADVGFGHAGLLDPIPLSTGAAAWQGSWAYRLTDGTVGTYRLDMLTGPGQQWRPLYEFTLDPFYAADIAVAHYYMSHSPRSPFTGRLCVHRPGPGRRFALDAESEGHATFTVWTPHGTQRTPLTTEQRTDLLHRLLILDQSQPTPPVSHQSKGGDKTPFY